MHYPVNVFVGKIRDYAGSRPSAIDKIQVDGELQLGDLGLDGDLGNNFICTTSCRLFQLFTK